MAAKTQHGGRASAHARRRPPTETSLLWPWTGRANPTRKTSGGKVRSIITWRELLRWFAGALYVSFFVYSILTIIVDFVAAHQMAEDYVDLASNLVLYPLSQMGPYGYDPSTKSYPIESISTLHYLKSPIRRPTILERWAPIEIAFFEAALGEYGKEFHKIAKEVKSKSTKEVVDFYYVWKKTSHYDRWKATYVPPYLDHSDEEDEEESKAV